MSLANKALLVNLHISQWAGRKLDKSATETVENTYYTDKQVGNYTKKLLPGAKELAEVTRHASALRSFFHENTLPWCSDGSRILASANYVQFTQEYNQRQEQFRTAVADFIQAYPQLRDQAKYKLGTLFKDSEYPSVQQLERAFQCEVAFLPLPDVKDFRVEVTDAEKQAFLDRMASVERTATRECWTRLHETVSKAVNTLSKPDAIFRNSLVSNIQEMCSLLTRLNVTDDPNLEVMRREVEGLANAIQPDTCRVNVWARTDAAAKLDDAMARMSVFMEGI